MNISEVLARARAGDREAYAEIVRHYQDALFGFLGRMGLTQARAEEIAQDTFLRAWTALAKFDARRASFGTWLYTIARRLALNELARAAHFSELATVGEHEAQCPSPQPPELLARQETRERVHAALLSLPVSDRSVLALVYVEELSLADVARIEACTTGAVKTRLHRARRRLAEWLENEDV